MSFGEMTRLCKEAAGGKVGDVCWGQAEEALKVKPESRAFPRGQAVPAEVSARLSSRRRILWERLVWLSQQNARSGEREKGKRREGGLPEATPAA